MNAWRSKLRGIQGKWLWSQCFMRTFPWFKRTFLVPSSRGIFWKGRAWTPCWRSRFCRQFLDKEWCTVLVGKLVLCLQLLNILDLLGEVLWIRIVVEVFVGGPTEPVVTRFELIWEVSVVVLLGLLLDELVAVGWLAPQREDTPCVLIGWFYVLVVTVVPWELARIRAELRTRSVAVE